jgi:hypothetical protein
MDEKKKLMVVGVLVVVIACVGGFNLLKGKGAAAPAPVTTAPTGATPPTGATGSTPSAALPAVGKDGAVPGQPAGATTVKNPQVANDLPSRDPFNPPADATVHVPTFPKANPMKPFRTSGLDNPAMKPLPLSGSNLTALPTSGGMSSSTAPKVDDKPFGYRVVGEISGDRPAVMLEDGSGNQKLVPVGSAIDGDSRVKRVDNGAVVIEYRGKMLRLNVGGNPVGK